MVPCYTMLEPALSRILLTKQEVSMSTKPPDNIDQCVNGLWWAGEVAPAGVSLGNAVQQIMQKVC